MKYVDFVVNNPEAFITPFLVFVGVFALTLGARRFAYRFLHRWAQKTATTLDETVIGTTRGPSLLWCVIVAIQVAVGTSQASPQVISYAHKILGALIIVSISLVVANIATEIVRHYAGKIDLPATGLTEVILKIVIIALGVTLALGVVGIDVTPLVAALGVGGLAVALGLQDTLANLFAGVFVLLSKPVQVGVHYDSDLEHVEKVTCEVAKEVMQSVKGGVPEFDPFIRYHTFADSSINFTVIMRTNEFVGQYLIKHEFIKRLDARYKKEGIVIPFPIRTLDVPEETLNQMRGSS